MINDRIKHPRVYIAGSISGLERDEYMKKFHDVEEKLEQSGYTPMNPAKMCDTLPSLAHHEYLQVTIPLLKMSDFIYVIDGRDESEGVKTELLIAQREGIRELRNTEPFF